jgi:hypothetical protein
MLFYCFGRVQKPNRPNPADNSPHLMKHPPAKASRSPESLIPVHGDYRNLKSFQLAQLCFDMTVRFCNRYVDKRDRTHDQMVQAARNGKQNIARLCPERRFHGTAIPRPKQPKRTRAS